MRKWHQQLIVRERAVLAVIGGHLTFFLMAALLSRVFQDQPLEPFAILIEGLGGAAISLIALVGIPFWLAAFGIAAGLGSLLERHGLGHWTLQALAGGVAGALLMSVFPFVLEAAGLFLVISGGVGGAVAGIIFAAFRPSPRSSKTPLPA